MFAKLLAGNLDNLSLISCNFSCERSFPLKPVYKEQSKSISGNIWLSNLEKSFMVKYLLVICEYSLKRGKTSKRSWGGVKTKKSVICWGVRIFWLGFFGRFGKSCSNSRLKFEPFFNRTSLNDLLKRSDKKSELPRQ